jgi:hypothetical protein
MMRIVIVTSLTFFVPSFIIGMISPVVVKLTLKNVETAGNVVGRIYAVSARHRYFHGRFFHILYGTRNDHGRHPAHDDRLGLPSIRETGLATFRLPLGDYGYAFKPPVTADTVLYKESDYYHQAKT